ALPARQELRLGDDGAPPPGLPTLATALALGLQAGGALDRGHLVLGCALGLAAAAATTGATRALPRAVRVLARPRALGSVAVRAVGITGRRPARSGALGATTAARAAGAAGRSRSAPAGALVIGRVLPDPLRRLVVGLTLARAVLAP